MSNPPKQRYVARITGPLPETEIESIWSRTGLLFKGRRESRYTDRSFFNGHGRIADMPREVVTVEFKTLPDLLEYAVALERDQIGVGRSYGKASKGRLVELGHSEREQIAAYGGGRVFRVQKRGFTRNPKTLGR